MIARAVAVVASLLLLGAGRPVLEKPSKYVTDKAGVIPEERLSKLNEELAAFERETSNQVVVYVDRRLPKDTTLEELANETFRSWAIGQAGKSNGVLFLVFVDDRAMRIEVGYGLEGSVTDAKSKRITGEVVKPFFKKGDYAGGIEAGARALIRTARGEGHSGTGRTVAEGGPQRQPIPDWAVLTTFGSGFLGFLVGLVRKRRTGRRVFGILARSSLLAALASFVCAGLTKHLFFVGFGVGLLLLAGVFGIVNAIVSAAARGAMSIPPSRRQREEVSSASSSWSSFESSSSDSSSSSSDSSSSSSDFSGGGGDSGGGGSSDNW